MINKSFLRLIKARIVFFILLQFPLIGYCDSAWINNFFSLKNTKMAANKLVELRENSYVYGLDFSPDGKYLAAILYAGPIHIWNWKSEKLEKRLEPSFPANIGQTTQPLKYSPNGELLAICHSLAKDKVVTRIWDAKNGEIVRNVHDFIYPLNGGGCRALAFSPDGKSILRVFHRTVGGPGDPGIGDNFSVFDMKTGEKAWGLHTSPLYLQSLAISSDGKYAAVGGHAVDLSPGSQEERMTRKPVSQIAIIDIEKREIIRTLKSRLVTQLSWNASGTFLAAAGNGLGGREAINVFETASGRLVTSEKIESERTFVRYTPDGKYLIESNDISIRIWDSQHQILIQEIPSEGDGAPGSLAVSADGRYFAVGYSNKTIVWQLN